MQQRARGFTLLELLVVVALIALSTTLAAVALRDGRRDRLEQEALRLSALLESARVESRTLGVPITWTPTPQGEFRFSGWPSVPGKVPSHPQRWLHEQTRAEVLPVAPMTPQRRGGSGSITLGPEPLIGPQRIRLSLGDEQMVVATDGLGAFRIETQAQP